MMHKQSVYKICALEKNKLSHNAHNSITKVQTYLQFNSTGNLQY